MCVCMCVYIYIYILIHIDLPPRSSMQLSVLAAVLAVSALCLVVDSAAVTSATPKAGKLAIHPTWAHLIVLLINFHLIPAHLHSSVLAFWFLHIVYNVYQSNLSVTTFNFFFQMICNVDIKKPTNNTNYHYHDNVI